MQCKAAQQGEWCGYCYSGIRGRRAWKGHAHYRRPVASTGDHDMGKYMQRQDKKAIEQLAVAAEGGEWAEVYPALLEFLTLTKWEDGKKRETGTIMILAEHGLWKLWLHDRDNRRSLWLTGQDVLSGFAAAEKCLAEGIGEWRPDRR